MSIISLPLVSTLTNGNTADAGQVTADLLQIASSVNANAAANGANADITSMSALTSITSILTISGWSISNPTISGGTITGTAIDATSTVPTAAVGTSSTQIASTAFVAAQAFAAALPAQATNSGKILTTNGSAASWFFPGTALQTIRMNSAGTALQGYFLVNPSLYLNANGL